MKAERTMVKARKNKNCQTSGCPRAIGRQLQASARDEECSGDVMVRGADQAESERPTNPARV